MNSGEDHHCPQHFHEASGLAAPLASPPCSPARSLPPMISSPSLTHSRSHHHPRSPPLLSTVGVASTALIPTPAFCHFISRISSPATGSSSFYLADGFAVILIKTLGTLILLTVLVIFQTSTGSLLICALMVGAAIVAVHGTFRMLEDLFLDIQELAMAFHSEYGPSQPLSP